MILKANSHRVASRTGWEGSPWRACDNAAYEIAQFDRQYPFASFLPGIAGPLGAPLWCMYVNRGQGVCSFGYEDKDHAIGEFFSSTWAYQLVSLYGFRTFLQEGDGTYYEPFANHSPFGETAKRRLSIEPHALSLVDRNEHALWQTEVQYCTVVSSPVPALCRRVRITNLAPRPRTARIADGLPVIVPSGVSDYSLKRLRRISEAFVTVGQHPGGPATFSLPTSMSDEACVEALSETTFYGAWLQEEAGARAMAMAVDPDAFFGPGGNFVRPEAFLNGDFDERQQVWSNRLPCAIALSGEVTFAPEASIELIAYAGFARSSELLDDFIEAFSPAGVQQTVQAESRRAVEAITVPAIAQTASKELNGYVRQNYLDNVLRGGVPVLFPSRQGPRPVHLYTRRHGDLERDYNDFRVPAHPYSEGAGNFRDVLQNRRHDCWFHPEAGAPEIAAFLELIQPDGYNPLSVEGYRWQLPAERDAAELCPAASPQARQAFAALLARPFSPGELHLWLACYRVDPPNAEEWAANVLSRCDARLSGKSDHDGYWIDHWAYLVDLLEAHRAVLPDEHGPALRQPVGWFEPPVRVLPRAERVEARGGKLRQYRALAPRRETDRKAPWPPVSAGAKLVLLAALKAMTLDPEGRGMEMEAGRPGWNDALNGLPGIFGSSVGETVALARLARYLKAHLGDIGHVELPAPAAHLLSKATAIASAPRYDWEAAADLREAYREAAYAQHRVALETVPQAAVEALLNAIEGLTARAIEASRREDSPLIHMYFQRDGEPAGGELSARAVAPAPLPLFLEAQVHLMRLAKSPGEARAIYRAIRESVLRDEPLGMFLLNEDLSSCSRDIGRIRTFNRGIYENGSVWVHMSYKLLVELLRNGLYDEFFEEAETSLVPFMAPERYGRSIFENSSYIASSDYHDPAARGRGFVARLSGSTAEFIHIWLALTIGARPFSIEDGQLQFRLAPVLPARWFSSEPATIAWQGAKDFLHGNVLVCVAFGKTLVIYHNPEMKNTWGPDGVSVRSYSLDGVTYAPDAIRGDIARGVRKGLFRRIDVRLG
ncbi:MAG: hypothetical protein RLY93_01580 [Sumerlaeia bacterium]